VPGAANPFSEADEVRAFANLILELSR